MHLPPLKAATALLVALLGLSACRSAIQDATTPREGLQAEPGVAAKNLFASHYGFYHEDPTPIRASFTPRFFRALKHQYDDFAITGQIGALDCDPWINAQDGEVSEPHRFTTLKNAPSEAVVRFDYALAMGPKGAVPQSVVMKFHRPSPGDKWQLADFIMPNNQSLLDLLEGNP